MSRYISTPANSVTEARIELYYCFAEIKKEKANLRLQPYHTLCFSTSDDEAHIGR